MSELRRAVGTQRGGQYVAAEERVVHAAEPRHGVVGVAVGIGVGVVALVFGGTDVAEGALKVPLVGIGRAVDARGVGAVRQHLVTHHDAQRVVLAQALHVVAQRGVPAGVVAVAVGQRGRVVALAVGVAAGPVLRLAPVAAQVEFAAGGQALDNLPCQTHVHADAVVVAQVLVVVENGHGAERGVGAVAAHAQVGGFAAAQRGVDGLVAVGLGGKLVAVAAEGHLAVAGVDVELQVLGDVLCQLDVGSPAAERRVLQRALVVGVVDAGIELGGLRAAGHRHVVVPGACGAQHVVHVVVRRLVAVVVQVVAVGTAQAVVAGHAVGIGVA